jgi:hypothetical protein
MLLECVSDEDFRAVIAKLVELAKGGDLSAIKELFDRVIGPSHPIHDREAPAEFVRPTQTRSSLGFETEFRRSIYNREAPSGHDNGGPLNGRATPRISASGT